MSTVLTFLLIATICFFYNKPISAELARLYLAPVRAIFGERAWVQNSQRFFFLWARATLYFGVLLSLTVIVLEVGSIFKFF